MQLHDRSVVTELLASDATFATVAHIVAYGEYGNDTYEMDILELFTRLEEDYRVEMSEEVRQKLQAILLATTTDAFFQDPEAFKAIANTLVDGDPGFLVFDDLTIPEILWSTYEVSLNHPGTDFTPAVQALIDKELREEGFDSEEEAEEHPYFYRAVKKLRTDFKSQLRQLKLDAAKLPEF